MKMSILSGTLVTISIAAVAYVAYRRYQRTHPTLQDELNDEEIQYVNNLSLSTITEWLDKVLTNIPEDIESLKVSVLPNAATLDAFNGRLDLKERDLKRCILIMIIDELSKKVIKRKLVIPNNLKEDLNAVKNGKIFEIPIK